MSVFNFKIQFLNSLFSLSNYGLWNGVTVWLNCLFVRTRTIANEQKWLCSLLFPTYCIADTKCSFVLVYCHDGTTFFSNVPRYFWRMAEVSRAYVLLYTCIIIQLKLNACSSYINRGKQHTSITIQTALVYYRNPFSIFVLVRVCIFQVQRHENLDMLGYGSCGIRV